MLTQNQKKVNEKWKKCPEALCQAVQNNHTDICTVSLESSANTNKKKENSAKPLFIALQKGHFDEFTVHICIKNNTNSKGQRKRGKWYSTAVHCGTEQ